MPTQSCEEDESSKASEHLCWCVSSAKGGKKEEEKSTKKAWSEVHVIHPPLTLHLNLFKCVTDVSCGSTPCCSSPAHQLISVCLQLWLTSWEFTCRNTCSPLLISPSSCTPKAKDPRWSGHVSYLFHILVDSVKFEDLFAISVIRQQRRTWRWYSMVSEETSTVTLLFQLHCNNFDYRSGYPPFGWSTWKQHHQRSWAHGYNTV